MKKRIVCLTLALLMSASQVVSVSASREDELREEQAITSQQLDATYSRMDELAYAKSQLENEISELDSNLVSVMVSIDTLKGDIDNKEVDIIKTKQDLAKAQKARDKQYESMKLRIQALYEQVPFFTFVKVTVTVFLPSVRFRYFLTGYFSPAEVLYLFPSRIS